jgi:small subunit ribosomal protein S6
MYILDPNAYARNPAGASESIQKMVDKVEGEILASRLWNEQKLAYPIKGRYKGAYWLSYFRCDSSRMAEFNRACQLNDLVLRHLAVKIEPRLVDALVAAAKGEAVRADAAEPTEETVSGKKDQASRETAAVDG